MPYAFSHYIVSLQKIRSSDLTCENELSTVGGFSKPISKPLHSDLYSMGIILLTF